MSEEFKGLRIGYAMTGSFCSFERCFRQAEILAERGAELVPIISENVAEFSTRFGSNVENSERLKKICGKSPISSITEAEPIGPENMTDILVVAPCTSNTAAKLANGITDTAVTMAVKSHLRSGRPVVLAVASNDSLLASAKNIGELFNRKNYFFVPMLQDDIIKKPASLVAQFELIPDTVRAAFKGIQLRPIIYNS